MPDPINQRARIGLSTATPRQAALPTLTAADMQAGGSIPTEVIARSQASGTGSTLRFPLDVPQYFMIFTINDYSRSSWDVVGALNATDTIALPLPVQMTDQSSVKYESEPLGLGGAAAFQLGAAARSALGGQPSGQQFLSAVTGGAAAAAASAAKNSTPQALQNAAGAFGQAAGFAVNAFDTVMLKGPTYKRFSFTWVLNPNSIDESRQVSQIKAAFDAAKAPGLARSLASAFFTWPSIFTIAYLHAGGEDMGARLNRFKPAVLTELKADFTPNKQPAFFSGSKAPESVELSLEFMELEYWLAGDPDFSGTW